MAEGRWRWKRWAPWPAAALLLVGLGALWWQAPVLYEGSGADPGAQATATATTRAGILAVIAATIAAVGVWASLSETRRANLAAHEREREAQVTDRYTKTIGQLGETGDDRVDVRLGGIYALQRIAEDSPRDAPTIVEVLCAFVRGHGREPDDDSPEALNKHRPPTDVQAALTVISSVRRFANSVRIDLSGAHIERANLTGANLAGANLIRASLVRASLARADLAGANLFNAVLAGANLIQADLEDADLARANLIQADLISADLSRANLTKADLARANLAKADLDGADFSGASLADARLTQHQLEEASGDENTMLPDGLTRPASWTSPPADGDLAE